jgi:uncharacterized membrane protein HdeD (DUF308 family)
MQTDFTNENLGADRFDLWWVLLVTGVLWLVVALVVLRFTERSTATVGLIVGVVLVGAGVNEFLIAGLQRAWRWFHVVMGLLLLAGGLWAFIRPQDTFWALASVLGFVLVFKGSLDVGVALATKSVNDVWWLGLIVGLLELGLGFWASQQLDPARAQLILLWVGFAAFFRGISEIATAFSLRSARAQLAV